jgi:hypothetical protein
MRRKWILCILSLIAIAPSHFISLAASYFQIISVSQPGTTSLNISGKVGLGYNLTTNPYLPFVIAAGVSASQALIFGFVNDSSVQGLNEAR